MSNFLIHYPTGLLHQKTIMHIIIIITLFQEDNVFSIYASLTYGPLLQR